MAWRIATGKIPKEYIPKDVYQMIKDMKLWNSTSFTQYPKGCPNHPSWPAMHSAASSMSLWLPVVAELTEEQYCQVLLTDYAVSFARTVAGIHYRRDNFAGLNMGQEVISHALPDHLAEVYGANAATVRAKIEKYRFDWRNFSPADCKTSRGNPLPTTPSGGTEIPTPRAGTEKTPYGRRGCELTTVDFNDASPGQYVKDQYAAYGLTLSASGGEGDSPRIFDTANPGSQEEGDLDLGTPNESCSGPGTGEGGQQGMPGENCQFLGNVLIIQEPGNDNMGIPDDNMNGGEMTLHFKGQYVKEIGMLDVDYDTKLEIEFDHPSGITRRTITVPLLGNNSYQIIDIDLENVRTIKLKLTRSGSVSFVSFCPTET